VTEARPAFTVSEAERTRLDAIDRLLTRGAGAVPELIAALADPSWTVRRAVVGALGALGDDAIPAMVQTLTHDRRDETVQAALVEALACSSGAVEQALAPLIHDPDPAVVADVAHLLGRRQRPASVPVLIALTEHASDNVAVAAVEALGRVGGRTAVEALLGAVSSGNFFRTFPAIDVLGRTGDPRAVAPLAALLDSRHYALEAARALGRTGDKAAVAPLASRLLERTVADVRVAAGALANLQQEFARRYGLTAPIEEGLRRAVDARAATRRLGQALAGADPAETAAIASLLGTLGDESAVPLLLPLLVAPGLVGQAAREGLRRLGRQSDGRLLEALRAADGAGRAALLPLVTGPAALAETLACLEDADAEVRAAACAALARIGDPAAAPGLFARLEDPSPVVVQAAIGAIQSLGSPRTESLALAAARSPSPRVRRWALRILAYFGYPSGLDVLLEAMSADDVHLRDSAIFGLPFMEGPRAKEALLAAARSLEAQTRATAVRAMGSCNGDARIEGAVIGALGDPDPWVRYYACQSAGRLRIEAAPARLSRLLEDPAGQVRVAAIEGLSHFDEPVARDALTGAAHSAEDDVRRAALIGLGIVRGSEALPTVAEATHAEDPATRLVALSALAGFEDPAVDQLLGQAADDPDESVRNGAVSALAGRPGSVATRVLVELARRPNLPMVQDALSIPSAHRVRGLIDALVTADDELAPLLTSALARMGEETATAALIDTMRAPNPSARKAAASTLGGLGTREALAALRTAAHEDPHPEVRRICSVLLV
jgi:HEAT repeat protein